MVLEVEVALNDWVKLVRRIGAQEVDVYKSLLSGFGDTVSALIVVIIDSSSWAVVDTDGTGVV